MAIVYKESNFYEELEIYHVSTFHTRNDNSNKKKCFCFFSIKAKNNLKLHS